MRKFWQRRLLLTTEYFLQLTHLATSRTVFVRHLSGNSRAYVVQLVDGNAVVDLNQDGILDHSDRYAELSNTGIAPHSKILFQDVLTPTICLGTECAAMVDNGNPCRSDFACLARGILGDYERFRRNSWTTENEREN